MQYKNASSKLTGAIQSQRQTHNLTNKLYASNLHPEKPAGLPSKLPSALQVNKIENGN